MLIIYVDTYQTLNWTERRNVLSIIDKIKDKIRNVRDANFWRPNHYLHIWFEIIDCDFQAIDLHVHIHRRQLHNNNNN